MGGFSLNLNYFDFRTGNLPTTRQFWDLFGRLPCEPEGELEAVHMDVAASIQEVTEQLALDLARSAQKLTGEVNLCLAGGLHLIA
jgi:carbamoyltransferase